MEFLRMKFDRDTMMRLGFAALLAIAFMCGLVDPAMAAMGGAAILSTSALSSQGVLIAISSSVSPDVFSNISEVSNINGPSGSASVIDVTDLNSTAKEKIMGLMDEGQVTFDINYLPDNAAHELLRQQRANKALCLFKITFTDTAPATTFTFSAYVTGFAVTAGVDQVIKASVTLEITGAVAKA